MPPNDPDWDDAPASPVAVADPDWAEVDPEPEFRSWYADRSKRLGLDPNPDAPEHHYDYRAAHRAGAEPDETGHWPSEFKTEGHPRTNLRLDANGRESPDGVMTDTRTMRRAEENPPVLSGYAALKRMRASEPKDPGLIDRFVTQPVAALGSAALEGFDAIGSAGAKAIGKGVDLIGQAIAPGQGFAREVDPYSVEHPVTTLAGNAPNLYREAKAAHAKESPAYAADVGLVDPIARLAGTMYGQTIVGGALGLSGTAGFAAGAGLSAEAGHEARDTIEAALFMKAAGGLGKGLAGIDPGRLKQAVSSAVSMYGTDAAFQLVKSGAIDWTSGIGASLYGFIHGGAGATTGDGRLTPAIDSAPRQTAAPESMALDAMRPEQLAAAREADPILIRARQQLDRIMADPTIAAIAPAARPAPEPVAAPVPGEFDAAMVEGRRRRETAKAEASAPEAPPSVSGLFRHVKTGEPVEAKLVRRAEKDRDDPLRGRYYTTEGVDAQWNDPAKGGALYKGAKSRENVSLKNPLVLGNPENLMENPFRKFLNGEAADGDPRANAILAADVGADGMRDIKPTVDLPTVERVVATLARRAGHDGIINHGFQEVVDLTRGGPKRKQPKAEPPPKSLSQHVREMGGINADGVVARGEIEQLSQRDSGSSKLLNRKGGGLSVEDMMQSARESGYDVPADMKPGDFVSDVVLDATKRGRSMSAEDGEAVARAEDRDYHDAMGAEESRLADAEAEVEAGERAPEDGDASFDFGANAKPGAEVDVATHDGDVVSGTVESVTPRRVVLSTPSGQVRIRKNEVRAVAPKGTLGSPRGTQGAPPPAHLPLSVAETPSAKGKKTVTSHDVMSALAEVVEAPIRAGRMRGNDAGGYYQTGPHAIRIREAKDISVAAHEVGHAFSAEQAFKKAISDPAVKRELIRMGRALYGSRKPNGGYQEEGVAELVRFHVSDQAKLARYPKAAKAFDDYLTAHPEEGAAMAKAREAATQWNEQGSDRRVESSIEVGRVGPSALARTRDFFSKTKWVEQFTPFHEFSRAIEAETGQKLKASEDPYEIASAERMSGPSTVRGWIDGQGTTDADRNVVGGNLETAIAPALKIDGGLKRFRSYLFARHAADVNAAGMNSGMADVDARHIVANAPPEFQLAADNVYRWRSDVLHYAVDADLISQATYDHLVKKWPHSVPLMRINEGAVSGKGAAGGGPTALKRLKGSGNRIRDPLATMIEQAVKIQEASGRKMVLDAIAKHVGKDSVGHLIEEVPLDRVPHSTSIEAVKKQLTDAGADLSSADLDATITHYTNAAPKGQDPIFTIKGSDGKMHAYQVNEALWRAADGLDVYRLPRAFDLTLGASKRLFTLGTTGIRAKFGLVTNPIRDLPTFYMNSTLGGKTTNPLEAAKAIGQAAFEVAKAKSGRGDSPYFDAYERLGVPMSQPLGVDSTPTRKAVRALGKGKVWKTLRSPLDSYRDVLQVSEATPRVAEMILAAKDVGWRPGQKMTRDQRIEMTNRGKRATVDFSASGSVGRVVNQISAFFNPQVQGLRTMARATKANPKGVMLKGLLSITVPTLALWWKNKDKDWYVDMPPKEKATHWYAEDGDEAIKIPRPQEIGHIFATLPEMIADAAYRKDPEGFKEEFGQVLSDLTPNPANIPWLTTAKEQYQNKVGHTGAPIVPRGQEEMPAKEQIGPHTTKVAAFLGETLGWSPRRIDHAIRGLAGGAAADATQALGTAIPASDRGREASDLPVVGGLFRTGGKEGYSSRAVNDLYDRIDAATERSKSKDEPETDEERDARLHLTDAAKAIQVLEQARATATSLRDRSLISIQIRETARDALAGGDGGIRHRPSRDRKARPPKEWVVGR